MTEETQEKHHLSFGPDPLSHNIVVLRDLQKEQDVVRIDIDHPMGPMVAYALLDMLYGGAADVITVPPKGGRH